MEENTMGDEEEDDKLREKVLSQIFALEESEVKLLKELIEDDPEFEKLDEDVSTLESDVVASEAKIDAEAHNRPQMPGRDILGSGYDVVTGETTRKIASFTEVSSGDPSSSDTTLESKYVRRLFSVLSLLTNCILRDHDA